MPGGSGAKLVRARRERRRKGRDYRRCGGVPKSGRHRRGGCGRRRVGTGEGRVLALVEERA